MSVRVVADPSVRAAAEEQRAEADPGGRGWTWVLDGTAAPRPGALAALLAAAQRVDAVVLASVVVGPDGAVDPAHAPLLPLGANDVAMRTVPQRVLPARAVSGASVLARGDVRPDGDGFVWTGRLLRGGGGFLVPDSFAEARRPAAGAGRLVLSDALAPRERLRYAVEVLERRRARRARSPRGSRG